MLKNFGMIAAGAAAALALAGVPGHAAKKRSKPPVPFTEAMMIEDTRIVSGQEIWQDQCAHCHGAKAYPGKAPKLRPRRYKPNFVYRRVTDGFRKMPAWEDVYSDDERMNVTIYIMSDQFSP
ncbi:MAG: cytochrome c [Pseudomonadota bacterium]